MKLNNKITMTGLIVRMTKINHHQTMSKTPMIMTLQMTNKILLTNLHRNRWRLKTTPWSRWAFDKEEALKWITLWTEKNSNKRILSGWIKGKTFLVICKIKMQMRIISRVVMEGISLIAILDRQSQNITMRRRRSWMNLKSIRIKPGRKENSKN